VLGIKRHRDAPVKGRPGYTQVFEAGAQEVVEHFIGAGNRLDEIRMFFKKADQGILVFGKAEEIALFLGLLHRAVAVRAFMIDQLGFRPEGLAGRAVPALVFALVDIAFVIELLENVLDGLDMVLVRGADEAVIGNIEQLPELLDPVHNVVDIGLWRDALVLGFALDLLAMLIRAGQEHDIKTLQALIAGHGIRCHGCV